MRVTKEDLGKYCAITILDHCIVDDDTPSEPITIEVIGRINEVTRKKVVLYHWIPITSDAAMRKMNAERSVILQSTIQQVIFLTQNIENKDDNSLK